MNGRYLLWACVLVSSLVVSGLCVRSLAMAGIPLSESLLTRGLGSFVMTVGFASACGLTLRPRRLLVQAGRAALAGLALTVFSMSYLWLTASAVSVLSNIDVPLLVMLGPLVGVRASGRMRLLALFSISFLIWFVWLVLGLGLEAQTNLIWGLAALLAGTLLLCFGYLFIKKSMKEENEAVTILVPSLAIMAYGLIQRVFGSGGASWTLELASITVISGFSMFGAYYATMRLYELTDVAIAEFPTLIASIVIQPFEAVFLGEPVRLSYMTSSAGFVAVTALLLALQNREAEAVVRA